MRALSKRGVFEMSSNLNNNRHRPPRLPEQPAHMTSTLLNDGSTARRIVAAGFASTLFCAAAIAQAGVFGSLANFDVVNNTGNNAYGFEIEIDDPQFDHTKITSVFGYDRNFGLPGGPGAVERYG